MDVAVIRAYFAVGEYERIKSQPPRTQKTASPSQQPERQARRGPASGRALERRNEAARRVLLGL